LALPGTSGTAASSIRVRRRTNSVIADGHEHEMQTETDDLEFPEEADQNTTAPARDREPAPCVRTVTSLLN